MSDETKEEMCLYGFSIGLTETQIELWIDMTEKMYYQFLEESK